MLTLVQAGARACKRKLTLERKTTLMPGQTLHVEVEYAPLSNNRSFEFKPTHAAGVNAFVDAKTPKAIILRNHTNGVMVINKQARLGVIGEIEEGGYFASTWENTFTTVTAAAALVSGSSAPIPTQGQAFDPSLMLGL